MAKYEYVLRSDYSPEELVAMKESGRSDLFESSFVSDESHGRLIDADAFKVYLMQSVLKFITHPNYAEAKRVTEDFCRDIDEQPTVLEANK